MAPTIYRSHVPNVPVHNRSIISHLFPSYAPAKHVGNYPEDLPAYIDALTGTTVTRAQTQKFAFALGYGLRNHEDLRAVKGETLMIFSQNSLAWPIALFGSVSAGLRVTLANSSYNPRELAHQYTDSRARLLFTSEEGLPVVEEMFKSLGIEAAESRRRIIVLPSCLQWAGGPAAQASPLAARYLQMPQLLAIGSLKEEEKFDAEHANETVYLCYSSGTTGKPKGVETTHRNLTAVLDQAIPLFPEMKPGRDTMIGVLPFYHIYGIIKLVHLPFLTGTPVAILPRFDPDAFCATIEKYKVTVALIVPPILVVLSRHPAVDKYDLSSISTLFSGAAPLGAALSQQVIERLMSKRKIKSPIHICQGYGLTETSPTTHLVEPAHAARKLGTVGVLLPNLEARLVVDGDGDGLIDAEEGQPGEIWVRGPSVMKGYLNNEAATRDSITPAGWFKTGDIAVRDSEGFYTIVDRRKELIKYKGFQVPPAELESVLLTNPEISDAAVIGVDSLKEATELPRAYVVAADPGAVKSEADKKAFALKVQNWVRTQVAKHKFLRGGVIVIDSIPKSPSGKILRRELRERAKGELAGRDPADDIIRAKL